MLRLSIYCFCLHDLGEPRKQIAVFARSLQEARRILNENQSEAPRFNLIASPTTFADSVLISEDLVTLDREARESAE